MGTNAYTIPREIPIETTNRFMESKAACFFFGGTHETNIPGKQVAVNFHQLYPWNQPQLPKIMVHYAFQVVPLPVKFQSLGFEDL